MSLEIVIPQVIDDFGPQEFRALELNDNILVHVGDDLCVSRCRQQ